MNRDQKKNKKKLSASLVTLPANTISVVTHQGNRVSVVKNITPFGRG